MVNMFNFFFSLKEHDYIIGSFSHKLCSLRGFFGSPKKLVQLFNPFKITPIIFPKSK
jgi:uncharacterized protein YutD